MIDKVRMNTIVPIPENLLTKERWGHRYNKRDGSTIYVHRFRDLCICYNLSTRRLTVMGRLVMASVMPDLVTNLDRLKAGIAELKTLQHHHQTDTGTEVAYTYEAISQDLDSLIPEVNKHISDLIGTPVDIMYFQVTYIEICFNVYAGHVEQYIEIFNRIFERRDPARYINFVLEHDKSISSSFYVKGKVQYEKNISRGYVINFYNKKDQLLRRLANRFIKTSDHKKDIAEIVDVISYAYSRNDLRMEVQCHYHAINQMLGPGPHTFGLFFDLDYCRRIVVGRYEWLIGPANLDFYSYQAASDKIDSSDYSNTVKRNLRETLLKVARGHNLTPAQFNTYKSRMAALGMHWFSFPARMGIDYLVSPIKSLDESVAEIKNQHKSYAERQKAIHIEAAMLGDMEISDDEMVIMME